MAMYSFHTDQSNKNTEETGNPSFNRVFRGRQVTGDDNSEYGQPEKLKRLEIKGKITKCIRGTLSARAGSGSF